MIRGIVAIANMAESMYRLEKNYYFLAKRQLLVTTFSLVNLKHLKKYKVSVCYPITLRQNRTLLRYRIEILLLCGS